MAESVDRWYQLNNLAANIAESAKDWDAALKFYERTQKALPADAKTFKRKFRQVAVLADMRGNRYLQRTFVRRNLLQQFGCRFVA